MTKETAKEYLPLVQALAEGKTIQLNIGGHWQDTVDVDFSHAIRYYRIKPEPRRWWLVWDGASRQIWDQDPGHRPNFTIIEVVEVLK